ncbi:MAG TPA: hypothetical protein VH280_20165 [Verrucomicrobiae bacterium]|nr:hypothetical protein [Verrucomicrobiae bacterium]
MKRILTPLALAGALTLTQAHAISLDDIQLWAGSGTNRAALVVEWNSPEVLNNTTVPAPIANKTMVWGYRFNGTATGTQLIDAIVAADPKLYMMINDEYDATIVVGIGYNRNGDSVIGLTDGVTTNYFTNGLLTNNVIADSVQPINSRDLYWSGWNGPNWQLFTEAGDTGGFFTSPNRGSSTYWDSNTYSQGQWDFAEFGLDDLTLTNGSWLGFSVGAAGYDATNSLDPVNEIANDDGQAPPAPDGTYVAYVPRTNDFALQVVSTNGVDLTAPYNDPTAILGAPTLQFIDSFAGNVTNRVSIINPAFNVTPSGSNTIVKIDNGGQITVQMGRKIYADPRHPYGVDLIVYGNTCFDGLSTGTGPVSDNTDLSAVTFASSAKLGHAAVVSVSQDGITWFTFTNVQTVFPDQAYRWNDTNASWTSEEMNPNKPLNPYLYTNNLAGQTVASALDQFAGAAGGNGYSLQKLGLPWIQYVRIQPAPGAYSVIDAVAAADPAVTGDALSIAPDNIAAGSTNVFFQSADDSSENQVAIGFDYVSAIARISAVSLSDLSPFAPVEGNVSSAYQIQALPLIGGPVGYTATVGLRAGNNYNGNGSDLRVFEWNSTNWISQPFTYNATNNEVTVPGVTNFSAFVVSQIVPPILTTESATNPFAFTFTPVPNCPETLERSTNLVAWTPVLTFTATNAQPMTLEDSNAPADKAFYRLQLNP